MAPSGNFVIDKGFRLKAATTLTKFRAVKMDTATAGGGTVVVVAAVGDPAIGVAQNGVTAAELLKGKGVSVRLFGITELEVAGAVAVGDIVAMGSDGRAKGSAPAAGDRILGIALTPATNAGERCTIFLTGHHRLFTTGS